MSAIDELRRMLTEAGVEWDYGITGAASTKFDANGVELTFIGMRDGVTCSTILSPAQAIAATVGDADLAAENAKLREQMDRLVTLLRNDCDIDASWDGLRKFWSIGLTEGGCLMRDRACKAEAENQKLREYVEAVAIHSYEGGVWCDKCTFRSQCYGDEPKEHQGRGCQWLLWAHELGVEVPDGD